MKLFVLVCLAAGSIAGQTPPADQATLKGLLEEVQKLRLALEKANLTVPRMQVAMQRVTLQEQRVARAEQQLDGVHKLLAEDAEQRRAVTADAAQWERRLQTAANPDDRRGAEARLADHRKFLEDQTRATELRGREAVLAAALQREQADLTDLIARLSALERSLAQ